MNSSDIVEDSADESKVIPNLSVSDSLVENSFLRPSYEGVVEESFIDDNNSSYQSFSNKSNTSSAGSREITTPRRSANNSYISSDEDEDYEAITRSVGKRRIRRIASDSDDEYEPDQSPTTNPNRFTIRGPKPLDSDEDDGDNNSVTSLNEISENSKDVSDDEVEKLSSSLNKSSLVDEEVQKLSSSLNKSSLVDEEVQKLSSSLNKSSLDDEEVFTSPTRANPNFTLIRTPKPLDSDEDEDEDENEDNYRPSLTELSDDNSRTSLPELSDDNSRTSLPELSDKDKAEKISSANNSVSIVDDEDSNDVICIPSDDDEQDTTKNKNINTSTKLLQPTLHSLVQNMSVAGASEVDNTSKTTGIFCTAAEYANQNSKVANLRTDIIKCKNTLRTANLSLLPDKGALLMQRQRNLETQLTIEEEKLKKMSVNEKEIPKQKPTWDQLQANSAYVVPHTMGKQAMNTFTTQKTLTMDRLKHLHDSLATCPGEDTLAEDPKGIKVDLMPHQKRALAWLVWRERQKPSGGILADDMGLGKTLTMISLILATKEMDDNDSDNSDEKSEKWSSKSKKIRANGGTLVICPATLIRQWESEIESKLKRNLLSTELHHGTRRETSSARLSKYDVVITTYKLAQGELEKKGPLYNIKWKRVILDEAHVIRNHKSLTSVAVCELKSKSRWALTGTPVHNKELDLYALLKFLRCSPFDDLAVWKRWVANKNAGGQDRLNTVITSILLRRTKDQLQTQGALQSLPEKKFEIIEVSLDNAEKKLYQKMLIFSKTLFIQFLHQRAEKNPEFSNVIGGDLSQTNDAEYNKMHRKIIQMHGNTEVKAHEILVLLLRLRQICCHPSLISSMLDKDDCAAEGIEEDGVDVDMLDKLSNLNIDEEKENVLTNAPEDLSTVASKVLSKSNPVFAEDRTNEKLRVIQKIIEEKVLPNDDKIIIVSQWTSMLNLVMRHLKSNKIRCDILDGKVPVHKRNDIVVDFNNPSSKIKVLLLSLTAGGVGLNLVGANHLLLVDLHWNPQLESQAQDRIYRVGQKKNVFIYKIVTAETIEERIKKLQDSKLSMASDILSGVRPGAGSKLSLDDLKMLFNVVG